MMPKREKKRKRKNKLKESCRPAASHAPLPKKGWRNISISIFDPHPGRGYDQMGWRSSSVDLLLRSLHVPKATMVEGKVHTTG